MTEQEYKEICEEVQNSGIPVPSQQKIIDACERYSEYSELGSVGELKAKNEKLQAYKTQMSIYAEQHKVILASDVLDILEELE